MSRRVGYGDDYSGQQTQRASKSAQGSPWDAYLTRDERILWEGQPEPDVQLPRKSWLERIHGLFFLGFSIIWMIGASDGSGFFALFGLPFLAIGLYFVFGEQLFKKRALQRTVYAVSTKNCFIATSNQGRKLKTYPITRSMTVELIDNEPPSVIFADEDSNFTVNNRRQRQQVGFIGIADGRKVFRLIREVQEQQQ